MSRDKTIIFDRRFSPLFWTQFLGALNDNLLKNALVILIAFKGFQIAGFNSSFLVALAGGIFIFPFFLFSPIAGQLSDKFQRSYLARLTKFLELAIMILAGVGFIFKEVGLLLFVLFLAGVQATLFGPLKYSMIPDLMGSDDLVKANAYIEMGTFLAILLGTIGGGILIALPSGEWMVSAVLVGLSFLGLVMSYRLKEVPIAHPGLSIDWNPFSSFIFFHRLCREKKSLFNSILGISWFWYFGAAILSLLPTYCKDFLQTNEQVVTAFLAMFTMGIGIGSIVCEKLSFKQVELGLVPIGALGMTLFLLDLYFITPKWMNEKKILIDFATFLGESDGRRLLVDFFLMSVFGGFFILPLYAFVQDRSDPRFLSRIIAGNNIVNALFMVVSSLTIAYFHWISISYPQMFLIIAILNILVSFYIYSVVPEFTLRLWSWVVARCLYRLKVVDRQNFPVEGPFLMICNHVSYVDWLIIAALVPRPIRFVIDYKFYQNPFIQWIMKQAKVIPICRAKEDEKVLESAYQKISEELSGGQVVCIFPEGKISRDGRLNLFRPGIEKILKKNPVPVVPMALNQLWGKYFSFSDQKPFLKKPKNWMSVVILKIGKPISPEDASLKNLHQQVAHLCD